MYPNHQRREPILVEDIERQAGEATEPPPEPSGGVPKQWLPGWIRWPLRTLILPFLLLDLCAQSLARKIIRPPYRKEGHCYQRGNCCHYLLIPEPKGLLGRFFFFWCTQINGFYLRQAKPIDCEGEKMCLMGCRYLKKDGRCAHYHYRPAICRQWPIIEYFGPPRILKGCGFRAVPRDGSQK